MAISPLPTRRRLVGSGVVTGISAACIWRPLTLAVPFPPPDKVTVKIESIDCTGEKVVIAVNAGDVELAKAVRALEHKGEERGPEKIPPRHTTSDASIVPDPVTWVLSSENRSPTIELVGPTVDLNAMENEFVCPDPTETPEPKNRLKDKPAVSDDVIGVGKLTEVPPMPLVAKPERSWSPTVQPLGKAKK